MPTVIGGATGVITTRTGGGQASSIIAINPSTGELTNGLELTGTINLIASASEEYITINLQGITTVHFLYWKAINPTTKADKSVQCRLDTTTQQTLAANSDFIFIRGSEFLYSANENADIRTIEFRREVGVATDVSYNIVGI